MTGVTFLASCARLAGILSGPGQGSFCRRVQVGRMPPRRGRRRRNGTPRGLQSPQMASDYGPIWHKTAVGAARRAWPAARGGRPLPRPRSNEGCRFERLGHTYGSVIQCAGPRVLCGLGPKSAPTRCRLFRSVRTACQPPRAARRARPAARGGRPLPAYGPRRAAADSVS